MSVQVLREQQPQNTTTEEEIIPLPPTDLPYDDGEPLESNRHRIAMNVLISSLHQAYQGRDDYYTSGNMFVYYSSRQARDQDFRGPDFFVVLDVDGTRERRSWMVWEEEGRYPDVIVEFMSLSTASVDTNEKKRLYERTFRTRDYFVYNPFDTAKATLRERESLQGWHLGSNGRYEDLTPDDRGWLWCESLGLWLGTWEGILTKENAVWARFYDRDGNLVLLPEEIAREERAEKEQERERANLAEEERDRERQRAENAETQQQNTQTALEEEQQKNQMLIDRLIQLGVDPKTLP